MSAGRILVETKVMALLILCALILLTINYAFSGTSRDERTRDWRIDRTRDRRIDAYANQQVEEHWRPLPNGNSKEDAARLTADVLKARNWDELAEALERNHREGR
jgi:hypothetical protein